MNTNQIQVRISLTDQLYQFLVGQSSRLGVPVTQIVKHMIIEKAQQEKYPTYQASTMTEAAYRDALANLDQAIEVGDVDEFFKSLPSK